MPTSPVPGGIGDSSAITGPGNNYIEKNILYFARTLRELGLRISSAEVVEALAALEHVDILRREHFRSALQATLVKDTEGLPVFQRAFEAFFASPDIKESRKKKEELERALREQEARQAEAELTFQGEQLELTEEEKLFYNQLGLLEKQKLREFLDKTSRGKNVEKKFKPVVENMVRGHLENLRKRQDQPFMPTPYYNTGDAELDGMLNEASQWQDDRHILYQDMKDISQEDLPRVARMIRKLSRKLATRISRRYRLSQKNDRVDLRRSIRYNIRYGGIPLYLKYKTKKIQKPKILLVCDVSGSMTRYSGFIMHFIFGLSTVVTNIESFVFAEDLERVTQYFDRRSSFEETMEKVLAKSAVWGEGTNFDNSLKTLENQHRHLITGQTVMIVVSDTKTLAAEQAAARLGNLRKGVREIIWLNTLAGIEWPRHKTVDIFARQCRMFQCNTLADLERVMHKELSRL
ncbi:MAG: vWA domain-containing protein [Bacillota bacterium]